MNLLHIESQLLVLLLGIAIGFFVRKISLTDETFERKLSVLTLDVAFPCLVISSSLKSAASASLEAVQLMLVLACLCHIPVILLAFLAPKILRSPKEDRGSYAFMTAFGNVGFIGFPVIAALYGPESVLYAAIFGIPFNLLMFTIGIAMISGEAQGRKELIKTGFKNMLRPCPIACIIGIGLVAFRIDNLSIVGDTIDMIGQMATPAALLIIGSTLARFPAREMVSSIRAYGVAVLRLIIVPVLLYFILRPFVDDHLVLSTMIVLLGMPVATNGILFSLQYDVNLKPMMQGTFISTLLAFVTIPLLTYLLG